MLQRPSYFALSEIKGRQRQFEDLVILYKPKVKIAVLNYYGTFKSGGGGGGGGWGVLFLGLWFLVLPFIHQHWGESGEDIFVAHRAGKMKKEHVIY